MELGIKGRVALVGGASAGIGYACALGLAREGARLLICARTSDAIEKAAQAIHGATGVEVVPFAGDLSRYEVVQAFVPEAIHHFGRIDILVNNIGGPPAGSAETTGEEAWSQGIQQTLLFYVRMAREALPFMKERSWGRIVNILSTSVKEPIPNLVLSNAARRAVVGFMKTLADEVARHNITVNNVLPGSILTTRLRQLSATAAAEGGQSVEELLAARARRVP
ncbi:MAG: SDR family NAD(P)-dependent oxidoreductase, partial [Chloroflexi bacterium]|nr:SDR family NAD(P)-dependent oxidoreductase [Chloroflexota bacterium]